MDSRVILVAIQVSSVIPKPWANPQPNTDTACRVSCAIGLAPGDKPEFSKVPGGYIRNSYQAGLNHRRHHRGHGDGFFIEALHDPGRNKLVVDD